MTYSKSYSRTAYDDSKNSLEQRMAIAKISIFNVYLIPLLSICKKRKH